MPKRCVAYGCGSTNRDGISLFSFPKDDKLCKLWTQQVQRARDKWSRPTAYSFLCSNHFSPDCFEPDSKLAARFNLQKVQRLNPGAVPSTVNPEKITSIIINDFITPSSLTSFYNNEFKKTK
uniref:THAP-type domain-containing protein n=1 Tax=Amphimedon queenslandica TaxID=400682 RepID=A0A1X7UP36_AMPQE